MRINTGWKIVIFEVAMLGGLVVSAYTLPGSTPLRTFLIASGMIVLIGNFLFFRSLKKGPGGDRSGRGASPRILWSLAILVVYWLLVLVFDHK